MDKDRKKYKILIVEDNPGDYALIEEYLQELIQAPQLTQAKDFRSAAALLSENKYDIILLDLSLPDKSGENLISGIMAINCDCPVIILTGYADINFGVKSLSMGASDYLLKDELNASTLYKSVIYNIERKKTVADLEASEKRYSDLFHLSPQPMFVYDPDSLAFLDVNQAAITHYGYSREEFLSMTIKQIRPVEDLDKLDKVIENSRINKNTFYRGTFRHLKKNGELIHVDIQRNTLYYKGKRTHVVVVNDITQGLKYVEAIENRNRELQEIAWMQSHMVRAPLARVMGLISLIKDNSLTPLEKEHSLVHILKAAEEFDVIIKDIVRKAEKVNAGRRPEI